AHRQPHSFPTRRSSDLEGRPSGPRAGLQSAGGGARRTRADPGCAVKNVVELLRPAQRTQNLAILLSDMKGFTARTSQQTREENRSEEHTSELQSHLNLV